MSNEVAEKWNEIIDAAEAEYDADIYFYSAPIDDEGFGAITQHVTENKRRDRALLILVTNGGLANSAYQIARLFQTQYKHFAVFTPSRCKSAGTLIVLGASMIFMDPFSELGPLDVQLFKQNEIASRKSGLLSRSAFDAMADASFELYERLMMSITLRSGGNASFKLASELAASMASTMMAPVYAQINPEVVGSENRDLNVAFEYGVRLVQTSGNASGQSVFKLVYGYPSHDFIIDVEEASNLFDAVRFPSEALYQITGLLGDPAYEEGTPGVVIALTRINQTGVAANDQGTEGESSEQDGSGTSVDGGGEEDRRVDQEPAEGGFGSETRQSPGARKSKAGDTAA
ncbi:hypothetical protein [Mesorhizobium sp. M0204]|uniref:SDH family Clp fold serine proteinase n=1 Tax=unclassified Mesorhizobium TaxID=325217 RepID=UPI00333C7C24